MLTAVASVGSHECFRCLAEGVERTRKVVGEQVLLRPVSSIEELTKAVARRAPFTVFVDRLGCEALGVGNSPGLTKVLTSLPRSLPEPPLILLKYEDGSDPVVRSRMERLDVREGLVLRGEQGSATCAVHLTRLLISPSEQELLRTLPDPTSAELWLAAARMVRSAGLGIDVSGLVRGIHSNPVMGRYGFRGFPARFLETWCAWARIHAVLVAFEEGDESLEAVARRFRFSGVPDLDGFCVGLTGEEAESLLQRGGAARLRDLAREWVRSNDGADPAEL